MIIGRHNRRGFTLVEVTVVLLITAIIAAAVSLSLAGTSRNANMQNSIERLEQYDRLLRRRAQRFGLPVNLVIDIDTGTLTSTSSHDRLSEAPQLSLPKGFAIKRIILDGKEIFAGQVNIQFSTKGMTPSYGIILADAKQNRRGLFFAGLTGQATSIKDRRQIAELFEKIKPTRNDTY